MAKVKTGKKLDAIEAEEYYLHKHERSYQKLVRNRQMEGVPTYGTMLSVIEQYHSFKKGCLYSFYNCIKYNRRALTGPQDECGAVDVFGIYKRNVDERRAVAYVSQLAEHFDFPMYHAPRGLEDGINTFYQAKYGMFTCHDTTSNIGNTRFEPEFVQFWQRKESDRRFTWYLAVAYAIGSSKVSWDDLKAYKK